MRKTKKTRQKGADVNAKDKNGWTTLMFKLPPILRTQNREN